MTFVWSLNKSLDTAYIWFETRFKENGGNSPDSCRLEFKVVKTKVGKMCWSLNKADTQIFEIGITMSNPPNWQSSELHGMMEYRVNWDSTTILIEESNKTKHKMKLKQYLKKVANRNTSLLQDLTHRNTFLLQDITNQNTSFQQDLYFLSLKDVCSLSFPSLLLSHIWKGM